MTLAEIQAAVTALSPEELAEFREWWFDQKIEADILAGRFEAAAERAIEDFKAGRTTPL